jgi:hypothetical protein
MKNKCTINNRHENDMPVLKSGNVDLKVLELQEKKMILHDVKMLVSKTCQSYTCPSQTLRHKNCQN